MEVTATQAIIKSFNLKSSVFIWAYSRNGPNVATSTTPTLNTALPVAHIFSTGRDTGDYFVSLTVLLVLARLRLVPVVGEKI